MENLYEVSFALIQALQALSPALDGVMKFFSFLGKVEFYLILVPLIYWNIDSRLGFRMLLVLIFTDFVGTACKNFFRQPRPYWVGEVQAITTETSYGFVSTHASNSLAVWGLLALHFRRTWLWVLSIFLVLMIGISRMYLGVHFLQDVVGGWIVGILVLLAFLVSEPAVVRWVEPRSTGFRISLGFVASLLVIAIGCAVLAFTGQFSDPIAWAGFSTQARDLPKYITLGGALFGVVLGYEMMRRSARFKVQGTRARRLARYLLGLFGLLVLYLGLDFLFALVAADDSFLGLVLRYLRYAAVTWFAIYGAPRLFLQLKLAEKDG